MKTCNKCNETKELNQFEKWKAVCKTCRNEQRRARPKKEYNINVVEKKCNKCLKVKSYLEFDINKSHTDGLFTLCKICRKQTSKTYYLNNKEIIKTKTNNRYHSEDDTQRSIRNEKVRKKQKERLNTDSLFKLKRNARNRISTAIYNRNTKKIVSTVKYLGCDYETLYKHIESQFDVN